MNRPVVRKSELLASVMAVLVLLAGLLAIPSMLVAQGSTSTLAREIDRRASQLEAKAVAWRRCTE